MSLFRTTRRSFLKNAAMTGLAGCSGALVPGLRAMAAPGNNNVTDTMTETRLLMGTFVSITVADCSSSRMQEGLEQAFSFMEAQVPLFDRHQGSTPLGVLNAQGSLRDAPPELTALLKSALLFGKLSGNAFDVTVQPLVDLFQSRQNPAGGMRFSAKELAEARELVMAEGVRLENGSVILARQGMGVTLDGIAKGHIADLASARLTGLGLPNHLVNAGGDIVASGRKTPDTPWSVAVSDPAAPSRVWSGQRPMALENAALATSGSYRTVYDAKGEHHHLISPQAGKSPQQIVSVSVRAKTAMEADALATALAVMPPRDGLAMLAALPGREGLMITRDGGQVKSPGWISA